MNEEHTTMPLREAYSFGAEKGLAKEVGVIRDMEVEWDRDYNSTVRRGFVLTLFEERGIWKEFSQRFWPVADTPWGQTKIAFFRRIKRQYEEFLAGNSEIGDPEEYKAVEEEQAFAAETDLRDFLAKNPSVIEPGLKLYEGDGRRGVEFEIDEGAGRIDLLMIDTKGILEVVELKVSRGRNKAVGQLLYYMGWVDEHLAKKPCRGIIVAKEITPDLAIAIRRAPGVSIMKYRLSVTLDRVG